MFFFLSFSSSFYIRKRIRWNRNWKGKYTADLSYVGKRECYYCKESAGRASGSISYTVALSILNDDVLIKHDIRAVYIGIILAAKGGNK